MLFLISYDTQRPFQPSIHCLYSGNTSSFSLSFLCATLSPVLYSVQEKSSAGGILSDFVSRISPPQKFSWQRRNRWTCTRALVFTSKTYPVLTFCSLAVSSGLSVCLCHSAVFSLSFLACFVYFFFNFFILMFFLIISRLIWWETKTVVSQIYGLSPNIV